MTFRYIEALILIRIRACHLDREQKSNVPGCQFIPIFALGHYSYVYSYTYCQKLRPKWSYMHSSIIRMPSFGTRQYTSVIISNSTVVSELIKIRRKMGMRVLQIIIIATHAAFQPMRGCPKETSCWSNYYLKYFNILSRDRTFLYSCFLDNRVSKLQQICLVIRL